MLPGFVDCSLPATQYVFTGTGSDASPLDWMTQYKQPANNKMHDDQFAASVFQKAVVCAVDKREMEYSHIYVYILIVLQASLDTIATLTNSID